MAPADLERIAPSPVVTLNRAAAVTMADGPDRRVALAEELTAGRLASYHLAHAACADLLRRLGRFTQAAAYRRALALATNAVERSFLERRLAEVTRPAADEVPEAPPTPPWR